MSQNIRGYQCVTTVQVEEKERADAIKTIQNELAKLWVKKVQGKAHQETLRLKLATLKVSNDYFGTSDFTDCITKDYTYLDIFGQCQTTFYTKLQFTASHRN